MLLDFAFWGAWSINRYNSTPVGLGGGEGSTMKLTNVCSVIKFGFCTYFSFLSCVWAEGGRHGWVGYVISCYQSTLETPLWFDIFEDWLGLPVNSHPNPRRGLFVSIVATNKQKYIRYFCPSYFWIRLIGWIYVFNYALS